MMHFEDIWLSAMRAKNTFEVSSHCLSVSFKQYPEDYRWLYQEEATESTSLALRYHFIIGVFLAVPDTGSNLLFQIKAT